ncbi:adenylate/guanylate cyclase domain-containing protein [Magnetococcus sp. PR-3]|uniref:adenylate/guanylate cyclase domain-containing protein n=1 Tax=Magnetococcus sp. PR-3 TaxID=3120355 RepID=UPI002FCDE405
MEAAHHHLSPVFTGQTAWPVLASAVDAIILSDASGLIGSWNRGAEAIFGYSASEALDQPITMLVAQSYKAAHEQGMQRAATGGPSHILGRTVEVMAHHKDGREFPVELSLSSWEEAGKRYFGGIIRDITQRKLNEAMLQENQQRLHEQASALEQANTLAEQRNQKLEALSKGLAKYLPPQVYDKMFHGLSTPEVASHRKLLTIFFSDLKGFTALTERLEAEPLTELLNEYFDVMAQIAQSHGGTLDKFIGDGMLVFFGDPESRGHREDAQACVAMALEMREQLKSLRQGWSRRGIPEALEVRMGMATGYVTVGNFGSSQRLDYTIIGSTVNLASRLESAAMAGEILISKETYALVDDIYQCEAVPPLELKGVPYPVPAYRVKGQLISPHAAKEPEQVQHNGFKLFLDPDKLDDPEAVKQALQQALNRL